MATATFEFPAASGVAASVKLFTEGTDTVVYTIASVTERTNKKGFWTGTIVDLADAALDWVAFDSSSNPLVYGQLDHVNAAATERPRGFGEELTAAAVWANSERTLTTPAAAVAAALTGSRLALWRGDSLSLSYTGLGAIANKTKLWWTVKEARADEDSAAILQVEYSVGLLRVEGAAAGNAADGSITLDDEDAGDVTIEIAAAVMASIADRRDCYVDLQILRSTGAVNTLDDRRATITGDVTRAVS